MRPENPTGAEPRSPQPRTTDVLRFIIGETSTLTGRNFLKNLVRLLATTLKFKYAFVGEALGEKFDRVRTVAVWADGGFSENFEYELAGTPCGNVVGKTVCVYPGGVQKLFPEDTMLRDMEVESYLGVPLFDTSGKPMGLLAALDTGPIPRDSDAAYIFSTFAARAGIAIERKKIDSDVKDISRLLARREAEKASRLVKANEALRLEMRQRIKAEEALRDSEGLLRKALSEIEALRRLIPVCASCGRIRGDSGYLKELESYISERPEAGLAGGLCPACSGGPGGR